MFYQSFLSPLCCSYLYHSLSIGIGHWQHGPLVETSGGPGRENPAGSQLEQDPRLTCLWRSSARHQHRPGAESKALDGLLVALQDGNRIAGVKTGCNVSVGSGLVIRRNLASALQWIMISFFKGIYLPDL